MHVVFNWDTGWMDKIEATELDEYKLAGLLGMVVTEGPLLPAPILKGHWRGFTVEITHVVRSQEFIEDEPLFPQPPEFLITFHLGKSSDVEIGIRHRGLEATGVRRPPLIGARQCHPPVQFARNYVVRGPNARAVKEIVDDKMQALVERLASFGPPELSIEYSLLKYIGIGDFIQRYRDLPGILGLLVEIARHIDSKFTVGLGDVSRLGMRGQGGDNL